MFDKIRGGRRFLHSLAFPAAFMIYYCPSKWKVIYQLNNWYYWQVKWKSFRQKSTRPLTHNSFSCLLQFSEYVSGSKMKLLILFRYINIFYSYCTEPNCTNISQVNLVIEFISEDKYTLNDVIFRFSWRLCMENRFWKQLYPNVWNSKVLSAFTWLFEITVNVIIIFLESQPILISITQIICR